MQERIVEIIVYVLGELHQERKSKDRVDLSGDLASRGYTENEINLAFSWVFNHLRGVRNGITHEEDFEDQEELFGQFELEQLVITPEAYSYLIQLIHLGVIRDNDLEKLVERALIAGESSLSLEDMKSIVASVLFEDGFHSSRGGYFSNQDPTILH